MSEHDDGCQCVSCYTPSGLDAKIERLQSEVRGLEEIRVELNATIGERDAEIERLRAGNKRMVNIEKAARDLFNWHMHVEGGIVPNEAWAPLEEAIYRPVDDFLTESTKDSLPCRSCDGTGGENDGEGNYGGPCGTCGGSGLKPSETEK